MELVVDDADALRSVVGWARHGLVERESLIEVLALAAVAGEHVLVVGPPGTAKSLAVRRFATAMQGRYFEYLLGRFSEPSEVFGPIDLQKLRDGVVEVRTEAMLPDAQIAFLDEVFLGSTAILNTLLGLLNERVFRRGRTEVVTDLRLCVGASNTLPEDPNLAAFADRFLIRVFVDPIADARLEDLLEQGWTSQSHSQLPQLVDPMAALGRLGSSLSAVELDIVRPLIGGALRRLRSAGVQITDRRAVRAQRLIAAAALLEKRTAATPIDLWPLPLIAPTFETQSIAREVLSDVLADARSSVLPNAAEEMTRGPAARAERIAEHARRLLAEVVDVSQNTPEFRLKVEATLRELDASLRPADVSGELATLRSHLASLLAR